MLTHQLPPTYPRPMRPIDIVLTLLVLLLSLPGCKRKVISSKNSVSPRGVAVAQDPVATSEPSPTAVNQEALRLLGPIDSPDARVRRGNRPAVPRGTPDAMSDEQKAALARAATEKAVSAAIGARAGQLQQCYEATSNAAAAVKVQLRVHSGGYVLDTTITGCNDQARGCMAAILQKIRVSGVQGDSITVNRVFNFRERKVIRYTK